MPLIYKNFRSEKIAGLYKRIVKGAAQNDRLCQWIFNEAGSKLAKLVIALIPFVETVSKIKRVWVIKL